LEFSQQVSNVFFHEITSNIYFIHVNPGITLEILGGIY
jgi:hypothetical protein